MNSLSGPTNGTGIGFASMDLDWSQWEFVALPVEMQLDVHISGSSSEHKMKNASFTMYGIA